LKAVRLNVGTEGAYFDGVQWRTYPPAGEVGVFDDMHAESLIAAGRGVEVKAAPEARAEVRPAVQPAAEIRQEPPPVPAPAPQPAVTPPAVKAPPGRPPGRRP